MSGRTLRLLVSFGILFAGFIYLLSTQVSHMLPVKSPEEGLLGGPIVGLTRWQLAEFQEGRELFRKKFGVKDGLGPLYNASSCAECHGGMRTTGGASDDISISSVTLFAKLKPGVSALRTTGASSSTATSGTATSGTATSGTATSGTATSGTTTSGTAATNSASTGAPKSTNGSPDVSLASGKAGAMNKKIANTAKNSTSASTANAGVNASGKHPAAGISKTTESSKASLENTQFQDLADMTEQGGPYVLTKSITNLKNPELRPDCLVEPMTKIPKDAEFHSTRYAGQIYGMGLISEIPDQVLSFHAGQQSRGKTGIHGKVVQAEGFLSGFVGRFGAKCQNASLMVFVAQELGNQLGISNQLFRHTLSTKGLDKVPDCLKAATPADPNDDGKILQKICFYLETLGPPPRATITPEATAGQAVFRKMNCAICHIPELKTPPKVQVLNPDGPWLTTVEAPMKGPNGRKQLTLAAEPLYIELRALENKPVAAFSDFLAHQMGPALADGVAQIGTSGGEWRTTPLWGLRFRKYYLHDGRAKTLDEAIALHGGEAAESSKAFNKLTKLEKSNLLAFLNSL